MKFKINQFFLMCGLLSALHSLSAMQDGESSSSSDAVQEVISIDQEVPEISDEQRQLLGLQLFELINTGNNDEVKTLLEQGAIVDVVDADNSTPLFYAIRAGNLMALKLCLHHGADVFHVNKRGGIPYYSAINRKASEEILNYINLYEGKRINQSGIQCISQQINVSRMSLREKSETIKRLERLMQSYQCFEAVFQGQYDVALELIKNDIDLNVIDASNSTSLFHALRAKDKNIELIGQLLAYGADVFHVNNHGGIPYHSAFRHGAGEEIIQLIEHYEILHMRNDFESVIARLKNSLGAAVKEDTVQRLTRLHLQDASSLTLFEKVYGVPQVSHFPARYTNFPPQ